jgi:hypothetical protein
MGFAIVDWQCAMCGLRFAICGLLFVVCYLRFAICGFFGFWLPVRLSGLGNSLLKRTKLTFCCHYVKSGRAYAENHCPS